MKYCFQFYLKSTPKLIHVIATDIELAINVLKENNISNTDINTVLNLGAAL
jgi:hypothetical protein